MMRAKLILASALALSAVCDPRSFKPTGGALRTNRNPSFNDGDIARMEKAEAKRCRKLAKRRASA